MRACFRIFVFAALAGGSATTWAGSLTVDIGDANFLCHESVDHTNCDIDPLSPFPSFAPLLAIGDYIGEQVAGSGLASIDHISLDLAYLDTLTVGVTEDYDVRINDTVVGSFSLDGTFDSINHPVRNEFSFDPIAGPDYKVLFELESSSAALGPGVGSLGWLDGPGASAFTISETAPEPRILPLIGLGLIALLTGRGRRGFVQR